MNNIILDATATGHRLIVNPTRLSSGSCNVVQIRFYFNDNYDPSWTGLGKTAVFYRKKEEVYHVPLVENIATVPREVLAEEGFFYFGLMGTNGEAIHTTEVVRLTVHQGAITTPTNRSEEYTPDIYEQLLAAHGVTEARLDQLVAMRGTAGESIYPLDGEYITEGSIRVNGCAAALSFVIDGLTLTPWGSHSTDGNILPEITPLFPNAVASYYAKEIPIFCDNKALTVTIKPPVNEGDWAFIQIINSSNESVSIYGAHCYGFYNLAAPYLSEVADIRVGADGKIYETAGNAVRGENKRLETKVNTALANAVKRIVTENPVVITDAAPVEHDVEVQVTSLRGLMPAYTRTYDVLDSATEAVVGSAKVIFDAGTTPPVVSVTFNELGVDVGSNTLVIRSNDGLPADLKPYTGTQLAGPNDTIRVILMAAGWISIDTQAITEPITLTGMTYSAPYQLAIFNGADVRRYGKNLFDGRVVKGCYLYADGAFSTSTSYLTNAEKIPIAPEILHTLSFTLTKGELQGVLFYDKDGAYISRESGHMTNPFTFYPPAGAAFVCFNINGEGIEVEDFQTGQLEVGETATSYEPYKGVETCAINTQGKAVVSSLSPNMTLLAHLFDADDNLVLMKTRYNRDLNRVINGLITADKETAREVSAVREESKNHANALKGKASGEAVVLTDVSPQEHDMAVQLKRKNLLPYPFHQTTTTHNGVTFTDNGDGSVTANGTATDTAYIMLWSKPNLPVGDYVMSGCPEGGGASRYYMTGNGFENCSGDKGSGGTFSVAENSAQTNIVLIVAAGVTVDNLVFWPQIEEGGTVTAYAPYCSDLSAVTLQKYGKNLVDVDAMLNINLTKDENGIYHINKSSASAFRFTTPIPANTSFALSYKNLEGYNANSNALLSHSIYFADGTTAGGNWVGGKWKDGNAFDSKLVIKNSKPITGFNINTYNPSADFWCEFSGLQIDIGETATEYEPYVEPTTCPKADANGAVNGIIGNGESMTLLTDTAGATIEAEYNRDANKALSALEQKIATLSAAILNN